MLIGASGKRLCPSLNHAESPSQNGFAAAQNLFRLKYDDVKICLKSKN
jgi:hypothetical protein